MVSDSAMTLTRSLVPCLNPCSNGIWSLTCRSCCSSDCCVVLILVLMEYGLWLYRTSDKQTHVTRLNPCSNGIWSLTHKGVTMRIHIDGLNPCSNGIWSLTDENGIDKTFFAVLILVLMEYGLWLFDKTEKNNVQNCLNPCSNGIWSLTLW